MRPSGAARAAPTERESTERESAELAERAATFDQGQKFPARLDRGPLERPAARAEFLIDLALALREQAAVDRVATGARVDAVQLCRVQAEDPGLELRRELRVAVHLLKLLRDREGTEGLDLPLRR